MRLSTRPSAELVQWAASRLPLVDGYGFPDPATAMGIETDGGEVLGVVVFHNWDPVAHTIEVSAVSVDARWLLARKAWAAMFEYAYKRCNCQKIWSRTPRSNKRALRFLTALGFTFEAVLPRQFGPTEDAIISGKFRERHYGQTPSANAA